MYDVIIGMDLMTDIGIVVDTETKEIRWEGHTTPLKLQGDIQDDERRNMVYANSKTATPTLTEAEERHARILDADYSKVNIDEYISKLDHLNQQEKIGLKTTLEVFPKAVWWWPWPLKRQACSVSTQEGCQALPFTAISHSAVSVRNDKKGDGPIGVN